MLHEAFCPSASIALSLAIDCIEFGGQKCRLLLAMAWTLDEKSHRTVFQTVSCLLPCVLSDGRDVAQACFHELVHAFFGVIVSSHGSVHTYG